MATTKFTSQFAMHNSTARPHPRLSTIVSTGSPNTPRRVSTPPSQGRSFPPISVLYCGVCVAHAGRPKNAPAAFIPPCRPTVAKQPPRGEGWAHELKHDGYRLQIHVRDGRVKLYTMNAADWTKRYPRIVEYAARIKGSAIIDAEVVCLDADGIAQFDALHSRVMDHAVVACAFDLLMVDDDDLRRLPLVQR